MLLSRTFGQIVTSSFRIFNTLTRAVNLVVFGASFSSGEIESDKYIDNMAKYKQLNVEKKTLITVVSEQKLNNCEIA